MRPECWTSSEFVQYFIIHTRGCKWNFKMSCHHFIIELIFYAAFGVTTPFLLNAFYSLPWLYNPHGKREISFCFQIGTINIVIIIMWCYQHGYFWPSLATSPYRPLLLAGLPGYIQYLHRASVCMFGLDVLSLLVPVKGSTGVHHLRADTYFSSSVPHVWFVYLCSWIHIISMLCSMAELIPTSPAVSHMFGSFICALKFILYLCYVLWPSLSLLLQQCPTCLVHLSVLLNSYYIYVMFYGRAYPYFSSSVPHVWFVYLCS